jgi:hypothetical protein
MNRVGLLVVGFGLSTLAGSSGCTPLPSAAAGYDSSAAAQSGKKYEIVMRRTYQAGKPYRMSIKNESTQVVETIFQGQSIDRKEQYTQLSFLGTIQGNAVPATSREFVVEQLAQVSGDGTRELFPAGTKLHGKQAGKSWNYSVSGKPVAKDLSESLKTLLDESLESTDDDAVFGSGMPRAVGEQWSIDTSKLPKDKDIGFKPEDASGMAKLTAVKDIAGIECLQIEAEVMFRNLSLNKLPHSAKVLEAQMVAHFVGLFPTNPNLPRLSDGSAMDMKVKFQAQSPNGPVIGEMTMHDQRVKALE